MEYQIGCAVESIRQMEQWWDWARFPGRVMLTHLTWEVEGLRSKKLWRRAQRSIDGVRMLIWIHWETSGGRMDAYVGHSDRWILSRGVWRSQRQVGAGLVPTWSSCKVFQPLLALRRNTV